eukprot:765104-Pleurochrysis_carterae.AAC.1
MPRRRHCSTIRRRCWQLRQLNRRDRHHHHRHRRHRHHRHRRRLPACPRARPRRRTWPSSASPPPRAAAPVERHTQLQSRPREARSTTRPAPTLLTVSTLTVSKLTTALGEIAAAAAEVGVVAVAVAAGVALAVAVAVAAAVAAGRPLADAESSTSAELTRVHV